MASSTEAMQEFAIMTGEELYHVQRVARTLREAGKALDYWPTGIFALKGAKGAAQVRSHHLVNLLLAMTCGGSYREVDKGVGFIRQLFRVSAKIEPLQRMGNDFGSIPGAAAIDTSETPVLQYGAVSVPFRFGDLLDGLVEKFAGEWASVLPPIPHAADAQLLFGDSTDNLVIHLRTEGHWMTAVMVISTDLGSGPVRLSVRYALELSEAADTQLLKLVQRNIMLRDDIMRLTGDKLRRVPLVVVVEYRRSHFEMLARLAAHTRAHDMSESLSSPPPIRDAGNESAAQPRAAQSNRLRSLDRNPGKESLERPKTRCNPTTQKQPTSRTSGEETAPIGRTRVTATQEGHASPSPGASKRDRGRSRTLRRAAP